MTSPADATPFAHLRHILTGDGQGDTPRSAAKLIMSPDFERVALAAGWRASDRLSALAAFSEMAQTSALPRREREIVIAELTRLALRVLWWEGLLGPGLATEPAPDVVAATLIEICATGLLPEGPAGGMVLERAKGLLQRQDVVHALRGNAARRDRLLAQLVAAEARLLPLAL
jgi:hypothetical protein